MPSNLDLMGRPDLNAALTKIHIWKQTQFRKVIYVDADMVALRAPDELFDLTADFSASPDIGWPDCFNSVCHPSLRCVRAVSILHGPTPAQLSKRSY
jgi:hypothetical protein